MSMGSDYLTDVVVNESRLSVMTFLTFFLLFACGVVSSGGNLLAQRVLTTVEVGNDPLSFAVNTETNLVYVVNHDDNSVSVIDGFTNHLVVNIGVRESPF